MSFILFREVDLGSYQNIKGQCLSKRILLPVTALLLLVDYILMLALKEL